MKTVPIVMSLDKAYVIPAIATIRSVLDSVSDKNRISFVIFHKELDPFTINVMTSLVNEAGGTIAFMKVQHHFAEYQLANEEMYYALLIPSLMKDYEFVFFLDADLIVTGDILSLIHELPKNKKIGAVRCFFRNTILPDHVPPVMHELTLQTGLKDTRRYFNAGLMLFNMKNITQWDSNLSFQLITKRWEGHAESILNVVFHDSVHFFSARWNFAMTFVFEMAMPFQPDVQDDVDKSRKNIQVQHFLFVSKPWHTDHSKLLDVAGCPELTQYLQDYKDILRNTMNDVANRASRFFCGPSWQDMEHYLSPEDKIQLS